jgi:magnesium transporter
MLDHLADQAEDLEERALTNPNPSLLAEINRVKHEALTLRRALWPLREVLNSLSRADNGFFTPDTRLYLRDIYDHTVHVLESLESVRDLLADLLDIYLSSVSNRLNTEVRILTVLTTLFMPATLIAGIFGMNFRQMPLLEDQDGFRLALGMMLGAATLMAAAFWRRNWLRSR